MKAIILFSGGVDSTVMLAKAIADGRECLLLSFDYGQRHRIELKAAGAIAKHYGLPQKILRIDPSAFSGSSLVGDGEVPSHCQIAPDEIPSTQVPARNTLFLAYALGQAEMTDAAEIHIGPNAQDSAHYPDCRPSFYEAFQRMANVATKQAAQGHPPRIVTPLIQMYKKEIVALGKLLKAPLDLTFSCYAPVGETPCQACLACHIRKEAFA